VSCNNSTDTHAVQYNVQYTNDTVNCVLFVLHSAYSGG